VNEQFEYRRLAALVADRSGGGDVGAFFNRELFHAYFYAGRPLVPIADPAAVREFLARPGRPIVLVNAENRQAIGLPGVAVIARLRLGSDDILAVRRPE
jgi:hypothetical protein